MKDAADTNVARREEDANRNPMDAMPRSMTGMPDGERSFRSADCEGCVAGYTAAP